MATHWQEYGSKQTVILSYGGTRSTMGRKGVCASSTVDGEYWRRTTSSIMHLQVSVWVCMGVCGGCGCGCARV